MDQIAPRHIIKAHDQEDIFDYCTLDRTVSQIAPRNHFAYSEACRSAFRSDVDHHSEVMPISIPN